MTPSLLSPAALATLAAVIVPLVIHIARRSENQPITFAALRWLRQKPRPKSRLRFDERLLLAARLLLLVLLAFWLAHPVLSGAGDKRAYVVVAPGSDIARAGQVEGEAVGDHARAHWLAVGFPALTEAPPAASGPVASLIRQVDADLPAGVPLVIVVPAVMEGADAERPRLSRRVDWRIVSGSAPTTPATPAIIPALSIRHDGQTAGLRYLRAAASVWRPAGDGPDMDIGGLDAALPPATRNLVWLAAGTLPPAALTWVEDGGTALVSSEAAFPEDADRAVLWRDALGRPLVEATPLGAGRLMRFTRRLAPTEMPELLEADFPAHLSALFDPPARAPARATAADYAPLTGARHVDPAPADLRPWLAVLIGLLLLGERWLATRRSRGVGP